MLFFGSDMATGMLVFNLAFGSGAALRMRRQNMAMATIRDLPNGPLG